MDVDALNVLAFECLGICLTLLFSYFLLLCNTPFLICILFHAEHARHSTAIDSYIDQVYEKTLVHGYAHVVNLVQYSSDTSHEETGHDDDEINKTRDRVPLWPNMIV